MTQRAANGTTPPGDDKDGASPGAERETFEQSMLEFAEGATALAAASLRLQMMMLEQVREMLGDFTEAVGEGMARQSEDD